MQHEKQVPIWFFIGALLALYGAIICVYSLVTWGDPPPPAMPPEVYKLHAGAWWGALMTILGLFYVIRFRPREGEGLTGKETPPTDTPR
jgi:hypothetical protein